jgi:predicted Zn-dependent peptidase
LNAYEDAGIFGLSGAASSSEAGALVDTFVAAMKKAASSAPSTEELANAKVIAAREAVDDVVSRQGRLNYFANLATTQTQAACVVNPIEAVTAKAVQELAQKALAARPSLSSVGILSSVPRLDAVISKLK